MISLTSKEQEILLKLFKNFSVNYNANSISKEIKITPRGALKILKKLEKQKILRSKRFGKAVFYKLRLDDKYVAKLIETLLISESREKAERWIDEFKEVFKSTKLIIIFGSIIRNLKGANDIDILIVFEKKNYKEISEFIKKKNKILLKKIHDIPQTTKDIRENLKENAAIKDAVRTGYVLHGQNKLVEIIKNVTSF